MLSTSIFFLGTWAEAEAALEKGRASACSHSSFFTNEEAVPCPLPPSFPLLLLGCSQTCCHLFWITPENYQIQFLSWKRGLRRSLWAPECADRAVLLSTELRLSLSQKFAHGNSISISITDQHRSRKWSPGIQSRLQKFLLSICGILMQENHNYPRVGKAVPRWAGPGAERGGAALILFTPPLLAEQDTGPS